MDKHIIDDDRIISTIQLVGAIREGMDSSERFCFILGSGASVSSGIPMGGELERRWMSEMEKNPGLAEVHATAENLKKNNRLEYDFKEIEKAWQEAKDLGGPLSSEYYFDIYKLRFFPNHRNGYHYLEKLMNDAQPSFGYHPLALMLTDKGRSNLVITTNFDSLVEDALFMYTESKPLVINHEFLADYAGDPNISRPIIAKVHRGIFFDPLNMPEETGSLKDKWHNVLETVFQTYTPIVIGYGGGDNSLMDFLADESVKMRNGIYWCYMEEYGLPSEKIQGLVQHKKGWLVRTAGFDAVMLAIGNALFPDDIEPHKTGKYLEDRTKEQIENYEKEYNRLIKCEKSINTMGINRGPNQSEDEFRKEIEKIQNRSAISEKEREKLNQMTVWDYSRQGDRHYNSGEYESAIESYTYAITKQPDIAIFYNNRGSTYSKMGEKEKALSDYNKAIELNPDYADVYFLRGNIYAEMGEKEKALSDCSKAIELNLDYAVVYLLRGKIYAEMGEKEKTISDYSKAIELNPDDADVYFLRGYIYAEMGEKEKALSDCSKAIELNPDYAVVYLLRGNIYDRMGEKEKVLSDCSKAIELNPDYADAYLLRGNIYAGMGEKEKALSDYNKAIELNPDYAVVYLLRGNIYAEMGEKEKVLSDCSKAIELNPDDADVYLLRGNIYARMGEKEKALSDYNKAIELNPDYAAAYYNRGCIYGEMDEKEKALSDYNKAIELNPDYVVAYNNRGCIYDEMDEKEKAFSDYNKAIELNPDYAAAYYNRGCIYDEMDEKEKALSDYSKAIELDPEYKEAYLERAEVYRLMGAIEKAVADEEIAAKL